MRPTPREKSKFAANSCISSPAYGSLSFINHYIFPGGYLPSITQLLNHISKESEGTLIVEKVENIGGHYAKALRLWKESFLKNFQSRIRPSLKQRHRGMTDEEIEVFRKKWEVRPTYVDRRHTG